MSDVVVVGGGIMGAFAAYFLAARGRAVTVIDVDRSGFCASRNNPGGINPLHGPGIPGVMSEFALQCHRLHLEEWSNIAELSGVDFNGRIVSRVFLALSSGDAEALEESRRLYENASGFSGTWLDASELARFDPRISSRAVGGLLTEGNATVDSTRYTDAVMSAARAMRVRLLNGEVGRIEIREGRVLAVGFGSKRVECDNVVFCPGPWIGILEAGFGYSAPVRPVRGEMLLADFAEGSPWHDVTWRYNGVYHHRDAKFWIGGTVDEAGFDHSPTEAGRESILENVRAVFPEPVSFSIRRHVAGLRPVSKDGLPILGRVPRCSNAYLALGGGSKGMLLSAGMGRETARMIDDGERAEAPEFLSPERFN